MQPKTSPFTILDSLILIAIIGILTSILSPVAARIPRSVTTDANAERNKPGIDVPLIQEIEPLSIRGTNYFPRDTPWDGAWTSTSAETIRKDLELAASLGINTVRIFLPWNEQMENAGMIDTSGNPSSEYLEKFDRFLAEAWRHEMGTMFSV